MRMMRMILDPIRSEGTNYKGSHEIRQTQQTMPSNLNLFLFIEIFLCPVLRNYEYYKWAILYFSLCKGIILVMLVLL